MLNFLPSKVSTLGKYILLLTLSTHGGLSLIVLNAALTDLKSSTLINQFSKVNLGNVARF